MNTAAYNKHARLTEVLVYAKLFTSIYQGTLRGNSHGLLVFTNLLAHCDKHGDVDMHPRAIAEEVGLTVEQVRSALLILESPDDESRSPEEQGRRIVRKDGHRDWGWTVVNYLKYRAIRDEDDRREQNRMAQERWRNRHKAESAEVSHDKPASAVVEANQPIQKQKQKQEDTKESTPRVVARGARLPTDWAPSEAGLSFASQQGLTNGRVALEAEKFRDYWTAATGQHASKADWQAAWRTWVRKSVEMTGNTFPKAQGESAWRTEQRERAEAFAGPAAAKRTTQPKEVFDVVAKRLD